MALGPKKKLESDILPVWPRASFIIRLKMFRKNATITNWKNIANVKHLILIGRGLDVYSRLILIKTEKKESWKKKKKKESFV